ncbi:hypothetical protein ACJ41O_009838 [Fusarium nematophilum]
MVSDDDMPDSEPGFRVRVWRFTYKVEGEVGDPILLNSPQESPDRRYDTLILRQINSEAENKVWIQEEASKYFKRHDDAPEGPLMDDAHGVIVRDGQARLIPRQGEKAATHAYRRGDRVWIDRSLVPTNHIDRDQNRVPVIDLESFRIFEIPFDYICFVPQLCKRDESGEHHATAVGPILNTFLGKKKTKARIYFRWPAGKPEDVSFVWLNRKDKGDMEEMRSYATIQNFERKRRAFRNQWRVLTKRLAVVGLLMGDEMVQGVADKLDSSSESDAGDLDIRWKTGPTALSKCCNLDPCPAFNNPDLDLVASYIGGYHWMEHYHVQDDDLDECPRGAAHEDHCVLRDNRTRCAYATDRVRHTCCKLRTNPLLPGPHGDPDDATLPLWETTAGDDYFIDVSRNVRTRRQLEDRDEIPPQLLQVEKEATQGTLEQPQESEDVSMDDEDAATPKETRDEVTVGGNEPLARRSPVEGSSVEESPADESPTEGSLEEDSPIDDPLAEDSPADDSPAEDQQTSGDTDMGPMRSSDIPMPMDFSIGQNLPQPYTSGDPFPLLTQEVPPFGFVLNDEFELVPNFDPTTAFGPSHPYTRQDPPPPT